MTRRSLGFILDIPRRFVTAAIRLYQRTFSPDHGWCRVFFPFGCCKYHPTCSQYTHRAVEEFGIIRGLGMGLWRVLRCNPWSKGGYDPVPHRKK